MMQERPSRFGFRRLLTGALVASVLVAAGSTLHRKLVLHNALRRCPGAGALAGRSGASAWLSYGTGIWGRRALNVSAPLGDGNVVRYQVKVSALGDPVGEPFILFTKEVYHVDAGRTVIRHEGNKRLTVVELSDLLARQPG